jgi:hypothetical protein
MPLQSAHQLIDLADKFLTRLLSRVLQRKSRRFVARDQCDPKVFQSHECLQCLRHCRQLRGK